jgi:hypothetical protein
MNRTCEIKDCTIRCAYGTEWKKPKRCKTHIEIGMINVISKRCEYKDCTKQPTFNNTGENVSRFCSDHKLPGMVSMRKDLYCKYKDCDKTGTFGISKNSKKRYCIEHKSSNMIDTRSMLCKYNNCTSQPSFDIVGGKGKYCATHKLDGMIDVKHKRCENCEKVNPSYDFPGGKGRFCVAHAETGMVNIKSKKCEFTGCTTLPCFDTKGGKGRFCLIHKEPGMINVLSKQCEHGECTTQPTFNYVGGKARFCAIHKLEGMIDISHKRCEHADCDKINPMFDIPGGKGRFCKRHHQTGMIDVKSKRCETSDCDTHAWYGIPGHPPTSCAPHRKAGMLKNPGARCKHRGCKQPAIYGKNLEPFRCETHKLEDDQNLVERECTSCHLPMVLNKDNVCEGCDPVSFQQAALAKQRVVMAYLDSQHLTGTSTDRMVEGGVCGKERPDRVYELSDRVIVLEVDEDQHKGRPCECEQTRMVNISQSFGGLPVLWIRFNPDEYKSAKNAKQKTVQQRLKLLTNVLKHLHNASTSPTAFVQVLYLYFDEWKEADATNWQTLVAWEKTINTK